MAEGDDVVGLGADGEGLAAVIFVAVEVEAVLADEVGGDVGGFGGGILVGVFGVGGAVVVGELGEAFEVEAVVGDGAEGAAALDFEKFEEVVDEVGDVHVYIIVCSRGFG